MWWWGGRRRRGAAPRGWRRRSLPPQLVLDRLHPALLLDEIVDDFRRLSVLQLSLGDPTHVKQVLQLRVQVVQIKTCVWIPAHMADVLEVAGRADVSLGQLLLLVLALLVPADQAAVTQHVVELVRLLVAVGVLDPNAVDLWVLDVHGGHGQSGTWTRFPLSPVEQVVDGHTEALGLFLTGEVQTDLTAVSCKGDEVGPGAADGEVVVELLFKHGLPFLDVEHPDEVGPVRIVLDQAGHSTAPLHPVVAALGPVDLHHRRAQTSAFPAQVAEQTLVLLRGEEQRAHVQGPAGRRVAVHGSKLA